MEYYLRMPIEEKVIEKLHMGDKVFLSGTVYTARDAAHSRLFDLISSNKKLPFSIEESAVYYVGPTPPKKGQIIGAAGPTTSGRMDKYTPCLLEHGLRVMIGKGERNAAVKEAIHKNKAIYLAAIGGAAALMAASIKAVEVVCWEDLGCEAVRRIEVENLPLIVAIDSNKNDIYEQGVYEYLRFVKKGDDDK